MRHGGMNPTTNGGRPTAVFARKLAEVREYIHVPDSLGRELADMAAEVRAANAARELRIVGLGARMQAAASAGNMRGVVAARNERRDEQAAATRERALIRRLDADSRAAFRAAVNEGASA